MSYVDTSNNYFAILWERDVYGPYRTFAEATKDALELKELAERQGKAKPVIKLLTPWHSTDKQENDQARRYLVIAPPGNHQAAVVDTERGMVVTYADQEAAESLAQTLEAIESGQWSSEIAQAECLVCGYTSTDVVTVELWNNYGECPICVGKDRPIDSAWYMKDGRIVHVEAASRHSIPDVAEVQSEAS